MSLLHSVGTPTSQKKQPSARSAKLFEGFCKAFFTCYCRLSVSGQDRLPSSSYILCANHSSHMDTIALMRASSLSFDRFAMVAARDYFFSRQTKLPFVEKLMRLIPLSRSSSVAAVREVIQDCQMFLDEAQGKLIIYPEGTRSLTGDMQAFKKGAAFIATHLGIPIVPAYISGTYQALPKGRCLVKPARVAVRFGEPIMVPGMDVENKSSLNIRQATQGVTHQLREAIMALKRQADEQTS